MTLRRLGPSAVLFVAFIGATAAFASTGGDEANVDFRKDAPPTAQEILSQSKDYYRKMQDVQKRILGLQAKAKRDRDVVKLNCVNDKLVNVRGLQTVSDQAMTTLNMANSNSDESGRLHEFTRLTILYQKVVTLGTEAEQCIGEDVSYVGATRVDVEIDPSIPPADPTQPELPLPVVERPPEASPFV